MIIRKQCHWWCRQTRQTNSGECASGASHEILLLHRIQGDNHHCLLMICLNCPELTIWQVVCIRWLLLPDWLLDIKWLGLMSDRNKVCALPLFNQRFPLVHSWCTLLLCYGAYDDRCKILLKMYSLPSWDLLFNYRWAGPLLCQLEIRMGGRLQFSGFCLRVL